MNNFELYTKLLRKTESVTTKETNCQHSKTTSENGLVLCMDCGIEIEHPTVEESENIVNPIVDINQYYIRKNNEKSIYPYISHLDIPTKIQDIANEIYREVCDKRTKRSTKLGAIIFGCCYHAYKINGTPKTFQNMKEMFDVTRTEASVGLKFINEYLSKDSPARTIYITPEHIIMEFMDKFNATKEQTEKVVEIYRFVKGKSGVINRSKPQSVAAGVIYYYIIQNNKKIPMKEFTKKVNLSELTVNKISKEVQDIIQKK